VPCVVKVVLVRPRRLRVLEDALDVLLTLHAAVVLVVEVAVVHRHSLRKGEEDEEVGNRPARVVSGVCETGLPTAERHSMLRQHTPAPQSLAVAATNKCYVMGARDHPGEAAA
jgi:hypothetical protein